MAGDLAQARLDTSSERTLARLGHHYLDEGLLDYIKDLVVMMGRYGRQDMDQVAGWPLSKLFDRVARLQEVLDREGLSPED